METITCPPYQVAELWMLRDIEHIPCVQVSLAIPWCSELSLGAWEVESCKHTYVFDMYIYVCVWARQTDRQTQTDGRGKRARTWQSVHTLNMLTVNQLIWKFPGGVGRSREARLPQYGNEKPLLTVPKLCWQTPHWLPSKLGNICVPPSDANALSQRWLGARHTVNSQWPTDMQLCAWLQHLSS